MSFETDRPTRPPLNVIEIASWIGASRTVTRDLLRRGEILGFKVGGQWRALPHEIALYMMRAMSCEKVRENTSK